MPAMGSDQAFEKTRLGLATEALCSSAPQTAIYRFDLSALEDIRLVQFTGSAWRGLLGASLKRVVCVTGLPDCRRCSLVSRCTYPILFETPAQTVGETQARFATPAHPVALRVPWQSKGNISAGQTFSVSLVFFGSADDLLPYLIKAMETAGARGIGVRQHRFALQGVSRLTDGCESFAESGVGRPPNTAALDYQAQEKTIAVEFVTPVRLKRNGHLVQPANFSARSFLTALVRRTQSLSAYFGQGAVSFDNELLALGDLIELKESTLRWVDWTRYSSRQRTSMQMGGLLGGFRLEGHWLEGFLPLIELGQRLHIGKATSMGMGQYRIARTASLPNQTGRSTDAKMGADEGPA